jgi:hypothetical protein
MGGKSLTGTGSVPGEDAGSSVLGSCTDGTSGLADDSVDVTGGSSLDGSGVDVTSSLAEASAASGPVESVDTPSALDGGELDVPSSPRDEHATANIRTTTPLDTQCVTAHPRNSCPGQFTP